MHSLTSSAVCTSTCFCFVVVVWQQQCPFPESMTQLLKKKINYWPSCWASSWFSCSFFEYQKKKIHSGLNCDILFMLCQWCPQCASMSWYNLNLNNHLLCFCCHFFVIKACCFLIWFTIHWDVNVKKKIFKPKSWLLDSSLCCSYCLQREVCRSVLPLFRGTLRCWQSSLLGVGLLSFCELILIPKRDWLLSLLCLLW